MDNQQQSDTIFGFSFDSIGREYLKKIAWWARLVAICAFVGYGFELIAAIFGKRQYMRTYDDTPTVSISSGNSIVGTFIIIIIGCALNYFLYKFSVATKDGLNNMNQLRLNEGLNNLRTYFKIQGILLLIGLIILGLAVVIIAFSTALTRR